MGAGHVDDPGAGGEARLVLAATLDGRDRTVLEDAFVHERFERSRADGVARRFRSIASLLEGVVGKIRYPMMRATPGWNGRMIAPIAMVAARGMRAMRGCTPAMLA